MKNSDVHLGDIAKDMISGFSGVVVAITDWLNGCRRVTLQPKAMKDGKPIENHTFDVEQLAMVKPFAPPPKTTHGGPRIEPVRRESPAR